MELAQYAKDVIPSLKHIDKGYPLFWFNPDKVQGFRLTNRGMNLMLDRNYKHWDYKLDDNINSGTIILLDQKIKRPYHINNKRLTLFDPDLAVAMALTNDDI